MLPGPVPPTGRPEERGFDGKSFLPLLYGNTADRPRQFIYGVHTQKGTINGTCYPVRSVRDERYKLIQNLCSENEYSNALTGAFEERHENAYWPQWLRKATHDKHAAFLVERYLHRPQEELYDLLRDPWELCNLAQNPEPAPRKIRLEKALAGWMRQQGDEGVPTEEQAPRRQE
jgi:N-sulfoglucosamine sulfohydrolase